MLDPVRTVFNRALSLIAVTLSSLFCGTACSVGSLFLSFHTLPDNLLVS